jgi:hypothetical protein
MASAFNFSGSNTSNPQSGLMSNLASNLSRNLGLSNQTTPNQGLLQSHAPTAPVSKMIDSNGNQVHFDNKLSSSSQSPTTGIDYYKNLVATGTPEEQRAGQSGINRLSKGTTGTTSGLLTGGSSNTTGSTPGMIAPTTPPAPAPYTPQNYAGQVTQAGQQTPWEQAAAENLANAKGMQNFGQFAPNAEAPFYTGADQNKMETLITRPDLVGRDQTGLYNKFANLYGTQANIGLQAAQTAAQRGLDASKTNLNASLPGQIAPGQTAYNPLTGTNISGIGGNPFSGGQQLGAVEAGKTSAGLHTAYGAAKSVGDNLNNLITSANINPTDPQFLNSINQFLQTGVASNPQYQQFYGTVNDYIASLAPILGVGGSPTDQKTSMASQMVSQLASGKSIKDTISYFDALAADKINAYDQAGSGNYGTVGTSGGSGGFAESW